jgi:hypothetical protein
MAWRGGAGKPAVGAAARLREDRLPVAPSPPDRREAIGALGTPLTPGPSLAEFARRRSLCGAPRFSTLRRHPHHGDAAPWRRWQIDALAH